MSINTTNIPSRVITSNQTGPHDHVVKTVNRQLRAQFRKPVSAHNIDAFNQVHGVIQSTDTPFILDSCCGIGESSRHLARRFPDHLVIGIDKSAHRLSRETGDNTPDNLILIRADLIDFWRLASDAGWKPAKHYLLYPNPWPKSEHLKRRWHGMSVFRQIVELGGILELRSNWLIYLEEFALALAQTGVSAEPVSFCPDQPITPFERKYNESGQDLWQLTADLSTATLPDLVDPSGI